MVSQPQHRPVAEIGRLRVDAGSAAAEQSHGRVAFEQIEAGPGGLAACFIKAAVAVDEEMGIIAGGIEQG